MEIRAFDIARSGSTKTEASSPPEAVAASSRDSEAYGLLFVTPETTTAPRAS